MHSSSEDIEMFYFMGCGTILNLFDTQIAAAWLGMGQSISLQKVVEHYESVLIEKQLTRTDWLKRPLSNAQLQYAAIDVLYLNSICEKQGLALQENGFLDFMTQDCSLRCEAKNLEDTDRTAYLRVKKASSIPGNAQFLLHQLAKWRELRARQDDKPRKHVLKDQELIDISVKNPDSDEKLSTECELSSYSVRRYGSEIINLLNQIKASEHDNDQIKPAINFRSLPAAGKTLNDSRDLMVDINLQKNIPLEVLPSKRWLKQYLLHKAADYYPMPEGWNGWRKILLEKPLQTLITTNNYNSD